MVVVVFRPDARCAITAAAVLQRGDVTLIDHLSTANLERDVSTVASGSGLFVGRDHQTEEDFSGAVVRAGLIALQQAKAEQGEDGIVEAPSMGASPASSAARAA